MPSRQPVRCAFVPKAELDVSLDNGTTFLLKLPRAFARTVAADDFDLPQPADEFFAVLERRESRCCFHELVSMLERRDHSRAEARRKLERKGFLPRFVEPALDLAEERRYISDARFAAQLIDEKKRAGWGRARVEAELRKRDVDPSVLPGYPESFFDSDDDLDRARALLARKRVPETRAFEKLVRHLMRKGFDYRCAAEAARERLSSEECA